MVLDCPTEMAEEGVSSGGQTANIARENSMSIPNMSALPKLFKLSIRVETCLVLFVTLCEVVASAVILALAKNEHPSTPLRPWIVGYLSVCAAFLPIIFLDYRIKKGILDNIVRHSSSEEDFDEFDKILKLAIPLECLKWVFACFYFVWFIIGFVWVSKGSSSRSEAPKLFWLCVAFLIYRGLEYALQIFTFVNQCCFLPCISLCMTCFRRSKLARANMTPA